MTVRAHGRILAALIASLVLQGGCVPMQVGSGVKPLPAGLFDVYYEPSEPAMDVQLQPNREIAVDPARSSAVDPRGKRYAIAAERIVLEKGLADGPAQVPVVRVWLLDEQGQRIAHAWRTGRWTFHLAVAGSGPTHELTIPFERVDLNATLFNGP